MRKTATLRVAAESMQRLMIYEAAEGTYLFLYSRDEDGPCDADEWYESAAVAEAEALSRFGVGPTDWTVIDDPLPGAQHDWIQPTRVRSDQNGNKLWGQFEPIA